MTHSEIWLTIVLMGLVTYLPRFLPLVLLSRLSLPEWFQLWLKYVPASIFGALIFSEVFVRQEGLNLAANNIYLLASLGVFVVAVKTKSLALSIALGALFFWLLQTQSYFAVSF